jgi:hypothetical protein
MRKKKQEKEEIREKKEEEEKIKITPEFLKMSQKD